MKYYNSKTVSMDFNKAIDRVTKELNHEGFGILTEIDLSKTFKEKLDVDFKRYVILGACNPPSAYKALLAEDKIGALLPCNVIVEEHEDGTVEVFAVNPIASMLAVDNAELTDLAMEIDEKLQRVISAV